MNSAVRVNLVTVRNEVAKVMFSGVCPRGWPGSGVVCLVLRGRCLLPGGCLVPVGCLVLGLVSQHALRQTPPPGETATAADGTHLGLLESDGKFFS